MNRPQRLLVVVGTGTGVGKTWVAQRLLLDARAQGLRVAARKPAQSFDPGDAHTDADVLAAASGESSHTVCPVHRWYEVAMAPPMAADALGRPPLSLAALLGEIQWPVPTDFALLETAGGLCSPVTHDADNLELLRRLMPDDVLLVADAGLGTLHAVRSVLPALAGLRTAVLLNHFDADNDLHRRNRQWLIERERATVLTAPAEWWQAPGTMPGRPSRG